MTQITATDRHERCEICENVTPHDVSLELRHENPDDDEGFSREPYRVASCRRCGMETTTRMNDA